LNGQIEMVIVVVKKTFRYPNVFFYYRNIYFYNHLCPNPLYRNIFMEKGITVYSQLCLSAIVPPFGTTAGTSEPGALNSEPKDLNKLFSNRFKIR
jgi:hypothetical protein